MNAQEQAAFDAYKAVEYRFGPAAPARDQDPELAVRWPDEDPWRCPNCGYAPEPGHLVASANDGPLPALRLYHKEHECKRARDGV